MKFSEWENKAKHKVKIENFDAEKELQLKNQKDLEGEMVTFDEQFKEQTRCSREAIKTQMKKAINLSEVTCNVTKKKSEIQVIVEKSKDKADKKEVSKKTVLLM